MTTLELENRNENRVEIQEKLTFEKLENGSVLVTTLQEEDCDACWVDNALFSMTSCILPKEQIVQVIEFLTESLEGK